MKYLRFMKRYLGQYKWLMWVVVVCTGIHAIFNLISPLVISYFIDSIIGDEPIKNFVGKFLTDLLGGRDFLRENLWISAVIVIVVALVQSLNVWLRGKALAVYSEAFASNLRNYLYSHIQRLPYGYHVKAKSGDLIQRVTSDVDQIRKFLTNQIREVIFTIVIAVVSVTIMFSINAKMASVVLAVLPLLLITSWYFFKKMQVEFKKADDAEGAMSANIQENLHGLRVVKAFNRETYEMDRFEKKSSLFRDLSLKVNLQLSRYWAISDLICFVTILVVIIMGVSEAGNGRLSLGNYFVFVTYISMVLWHVRSFGRVLSDLGKVTVAINRLEEIVNVEEEDLDTGVQPEIKGNIVFDNVSFKYDDGEEDVLNNLSLTVSEGETVALMGPTGSGKSSLVYLLTRLYDYQDGDIYIDGVKLADISRDYIRSKVGLVLQEPFLFSKNILENIRIASPQATEDEVYEAAKRSEMHSVISTFDLGYQTLVGEKGVTLSGGQKQRIAIARTVINDYPILVFDDSLSAVDTQTDASIREHLKNNRKSTTFIITHRVSSAMDADKIIVLDKGTVVQTGTHQELLNKEGLYQRIAKIQNIFQEKEGYND